MIIMKILRHGKRMNENIYYLFQKEKEKRMLSKERKNKRRLTDGKTPKFSVLCYDKILPGYFEINISSNVL
jgi:hypothetical protein